MSPTALQREVRALLARHGLELRRVHDGGAGRLYRFAVVELEEGGLRLLRWPATSDRTAQRTLRAEAEAVALAHPRVPVAVPVQFLGETEDGPEAALAPVLPGDRARSVLRQAPHGHDRRACHAVGGLLAALHSVRYARPWPAHAIPELEGAGEAAVLLHRDAHLGNVLLDERGGPPRITGLIDWSFCAFGPPEADLVELAITEAVPDPARGEAVLRGYREAGGAEPRADVFAAALSAELTRRLREHPQRRQPAVRALWQGWAKALRQRGARPLRVFSAQRSPGRGLC